MEITKKRVIVGAGAAAVLVIRLAAGAVALSAGATASVPSDSAIFLWDGATGGPSETAGTVHAYDQALYWSADAENILEPIVCPPASTGVWTFVAQPGRERAGTDGWTAYSVSGFNPTPEVEGRLEVLTPTATLDYQSDGPADGYSVIAKDGGDWSLGVACTGADQAVTASFYRTIHVTAGTGAFTADEATAAR